MTRFGIVTGMRVEQECLDAAFQNSDTTHRPLLFCAGGDTDRAYEGSHRLVDDGAEILVSFGIAGGLAPALKPGDLILADAVVAAGKQRWESDAAPRAPLNRALDPAAVGPIYGASEVIRSPSEKAALHAETGALAVDMESRGVAQAAAETALPFLAIRVVADPAHRAIPSSALHGLDADGNRRALPVLARLLLKPWELPGLIRIARDSATALNTLGRVATLGHGLFVGRGPV